MTKPVTRKAIHTALRVGVNLAPDLTKRMAWTIFCTPLWASKPTPRQVDILSRSSQSYIRFGERNLKVHRWGDRGPVVLMVHGWGGRAHVFGEMVPGLLEKGFSVVAFDGPAHNNRGGRTNMMEYSSAVQHVAREVGPVKGLVGHSFGAITAAHASRFLEGLEAVALLGAPDDLDFVLGRAQDMVTAPQSVMDYIYRRIEKLSGQPVPEHASSLFLQERGLPAVIFHDTGDEEIPYEHAREMATKIGAEFVLTEGWGHHRILNSPEVASKMADFFSERISEPSPSTVR